MAAPRGSLRQVSVRCPLPASSYRLPASRQDDQTATSPERFWSDRGDL